MLETREALGIMQAMEAKDDWTLSRRPSARNSTTIRPFTKATAPGL